MTIVVATPEARADGLRVALSTLCAHASWANRRVLEAAGRLTVGQFAAVDHPSVGSARDLLVRMVGAERAWLARARSEAVPPELDPNAFPDAAAVAAVWAPLDEASRAFVDGLSERQPTGLVRDVDGDGSARSVPLWQVLLEGATDAARRRGELALVLTEKGHAPGPLAVRDFLGEAEGSRGEGPASTSPAAGGEAASAVETAYDTVAATYADRFGDELAHKPFDRRWLDAVAELTAGLGPICDLGCGPGQVARYLHDGGAEVFGADLSAGMVEEARRRQPGIRFERQDLLALTIPAASLGGIVASYAIVHCTLDQVAIACREMYRVLVPGGWLSLSFHVGDDWRRVEGFLGEPVALDFAFFEPDEIIARLEAAGFEVEEAAIRYPYRDVEYPSRRAYLLARRPSGGG